MLKQMLAAVALAAIAASPAWSAPCRDSHGKFVKCTAKAQAAPKRCKDAHGKFAKCGSPGAKPA